MVTTLTPFEALVLAVKRAGGQSAAGRICGKSQSAVWKWLQSSKRLPPEHVLQMEAATGVSRHVLRPDIYPPSERQQGDEPGQDCGSILTKTPSPVVCDQRGKAQRKDAA